MDKELKKIVELALTEDIGSGDLSSSLLDDVIINAEIICRDRATICGTEYFDLCFLSLDKDIEIRWNLKDGDEVQPGEVICNIKGRSRSIITAERTALNFLQILSGTSTKTNYLVNLIGRTKAQLLDTRKTIPGLRKAQKYAVKCGGGVNHRMGLYDCIMLKENHILSIGSLDKSIKKALKKYPEKPIVVEVETLEQLRCVLSIKGITRVLCDNFSLIDLKEAVKIAQGVYPIEASGGVNETNIVSYAETGVDYISIGSVTKDVAAVDLSLRFS
ncbi:MAG: carboxylating nicotinate-nucleotide diphosphorylase [Candidatus Thioglobus sp.]|jgi:nicotinate-nucleotide pyrophosphorylase (carboxylating)|nr:carboxylating nicotinate-nucleotide diphosphorylase [Candidatus Pseudothioglobus aerophilus]MBT6634270.1 carboxylating nicotinate-nucleotide diphosphorylase [Gammaproteobacteria bacterium]